MSIIGLLNSGNSMGEVSTTAKKPTRLKWVRRMAVVLVIYTVVGFFVAPAIIKSQMLKRLPALTKRQVTVTQVKCNPYVLSLTIRGFALKEANGDVFSSFDEFYVNFQPWASLFKWSWVFDEISLKRPFAQIIYQPDGSFNFMNLLTNAAPAARPPPASSAPPALPAVVIYKLQITNGAVAFADLNRKTPFRTQFAPIDVHLTNLTTIRDRKGPYSFLARTDSGEIFAWSGTITLNPLRSDGTFRLGGLQLPEFATYVHDYARFDITRGKLDVYADYRYDSVTNALDLSVSNAAVYLTTLEIKTPDTGETAISIPSLAVTKTEASVARRTARVGLVKSSNGSILARQNHEGTINLLAQLNLPAKPATGGQQSAPAEAAAFSAKIDEIAFDNYSIKAEDQKPAKPAAFNIDRLGFDLKGVSNLTNAPVTVDMSLRFQDTGSIAANGTATLLPPSADLGIMVTNIDLRAIQPYVEEQIKLAITSGGLSAQGRARYASPEPGAPLISFAGNASVDKFATSDDVLFKDFTKWDALEIGGINLHIQPDKLSVDEVKFTGLSASLVVGPDHRANLQTILRNQIAAKTNAAAATAATEVPATPPAATNKIPDLALGTLAFENASIHFSDQSIEPHCTFDVQEFGGTIKGLSSQPDTTAAVDVNGKVDARSPFNVSGKVHPLGDLFADIAVAFTNTELTAFTPYTEKFAGRPLQKGKLSFGVHYLVNHNDLKAENGFYVDQLTLGPKNNSPDATSLPVKLAIALLKDRNGRIKLDVPVTGRIDDPKFRLGPIIWQVVMNLIVKAATSPFSLLGAMFGGGEELSFVEFAPGQSAIPDAQTNKLETLIKALYERPELTMEINGSVDPALDREPLARNKLDQQIKSLWIKKLTDAGKPAVALEEVHLEPADYERLLKKVYRTTLGDYKPTEAATNQAPGLAGEAVAAAGVSPAAAPDHGATLLLAPVRLVKPAAMKTPVVAPGGNPAAMPTPTTPEIADMEAQLSRKMEVTDDDLRDLMNQRAARVQAYLLKDGKLDAGRLFITAPKPVSAASKGADRVNLTLD